MKKSKLKKLLKPKHFIKIEGFRFCPHSMIITLKTNKNLELFEGVPYNFQIPLN